MSADTVLLADIGGTHARFALLADGEIRHAASLRCAGHDGPVAAARAWLAALPGIRPGRGAFAVAAVIDGDAVAVPNSGWRFSLAATRDALGLSGLEAINDFTAIALAIPRLGPGDVLTIGGGTPHPGSPVAVLGPGTGLGVSALVMGRDGRWVALDTEGGNVTLAAATDREAAILDQLRRDGAPVVAERVLSGPGLVTLYRTIAALAGRPAPLSAPDAVTRSARDGSCPLCREALDTFFALLGTVAANLALTLGARGGVFLAGGILPRLAEEVRASGFRARFDDHGAFGPYLAAIPTRLILHPHPAFLGLASLT